jgi:hypothetical protein
MINTALARAHYWIGMDGGPMKARLDPATKLFSFVVPSEYVGRAALYTQWPIARLFGTFGADMPKAIGALGGPEEFMYTFGPDAPTNGRRTVYTQEASTLSAWSDPVDIEIVVCDGTEFPGTVAMTDYTPPPEFSDRSPYRYRGPIVWTSCPSGGSSVGVYYRFASGPSAGVRRPVMLREGDYWRAVFGF